MPNMLGTTLGIVALVLSAAGGAGAQPAAGSGPASAISTSDPERATLPVIGAMLEHRDALGLSAGQVETLERLGLDLVRDAIRRQAELMIGQLDLDMLLDQDPDRTVNVTAAEGKIREIERTRTELQLALVRAVEAARSALTVEQRGRLVPLLTGGAGAAQSADDPGDPARAAAPPPRGGGPVHRPPSGGPGHVRPHDGRPDGRRDGGRAIIRTWPPFWWTPYWFYSPPPVVVQEPPVYAPPAYWYYCASAQAYYPYVTSCPEAWIQVPASP